MDQLSVVSPIGDPPQSGSNAQMKTQQITAPKNLKKVVPINTEEETLSKEAAPIPPSHVVEHNGEEALLSQEVESVNAHHIEPALSPDDMEALILGTKSYEIERTSHLLSILELQLKEYQSLPDRLAQAELDREQLIERNNILQKKRIDQNERLLALEREMIEVKMALANQKETGDYSRFSLKKLTCIHQLLEKENLYLENKLREFENSLVSNHSISKSNSHVNLSTQQFNTDTKEKVQRTLSLEAVGQKYMFPSSQNEKSSLWRSTLSANAVSDLSSSRNKSFSDSFFLSKFLGNRKS